VTRKMPDDAVPSPARVRPQRSRNSEKCPVWQFHLVYSDDKTKTGAKGFAVVPVIGCLECKQPVIDAVPARAGTHARARARLSG
jgi:tryptophanyl-tRNA synthetase